jgi:PPM family protein phosphatase
MIAIGRAAGVTDTGRRRLRNEDTFVCEPPLFAVADGMGGARAGEIAAELAATALEEGAGGTRGPNALVELIEEANRRIWERSVADPKTTGMGAVATVALVDDGSETVAIGHVGDSRAYLLREGAIEQLTRDHSLVAELVESGVLTPEEAERHPQRSAITRALGTEPAVEADVFTLDALPGDLFLLCSDGLTDMLSEDQIAAAIETADRDPATAGDALVAAANAEGGEDNITVLLFELVTGDPGAAAGAEADGGAAGESEDGIGSRPDTLTREPQEVDGAPDLPAPSRRHGAGAGGRLAAILLIAAVVIGGALLLYWGVVR